MNRFVRITLTVPVLGLGLVLAGGEGFDPTAVFDMEIFNTKKKLPGERRAVFPEAHRACRRACHRNWSRVISRHPNKLTNRRRKRPRNSRPNRRRQSPNPSRSRKSRPSRRKSRPLRPARLGRRRSRRRNGPTRRLPNSSRRAAGGPPPRSLRAASPGLTRRRRGSRWPGRSLCGRPARGWRLPDNAAIVLVAAAGHRACSDGAESASRKMRQTLEGTAAPVTRRARS